MQAETLLKIDFLASKRTVFLTEQTAMRALQYSTVRSEPDGIGQNGILEHFKWLHMV